MANFSGGLNTEVQPNIIAWSHNYQKYVYLLINRLFKLCHSFFAIMSKMVKKFKNYALSKWLVYTGMYVIFNHLADFVRFYTTVIFT